MKKQNNSVNIMSVKSRISVTVLCALLGATEVNANNNSSSDLNSISKEVKAEPKNENGLNRNLTTWVANNEEEVAEVKVIDAIAQWIADSSYWSSDDSLSADQKVSENRGQMFRSNSNTGKISAGNKTYFFNAEPYILNSEF